MALTNVQKQKRYRENTKLVIRFYEELTGIKASNVRKQITKRRHQNEKKNKNIESQK